jgi:hypothetical protein
LETGTNWVLASQWAERSQMSLFKIFEYELNAQSSQHPRHISYYYFK